MGDVIEPILLIRCRDCAKSHVVEVMEHRARGAGGVAGEDAGLFDG